MEKILKTAQELSTLNNNIQLLLKRIATVEGLIEHEIIDIISDSKNVETTLDEQVSLFCANYFAQAATYIGHAAAQHGRGRCSLYSVLPCFGANQKRYDLSLYHDNDCRLSDDRTPFIPMKEYCHAH